MVAVASIPVTDRTWAVDGSRHTSRPPSSGEAGVAGSGSAEDDDGEDEAEDGDDEGEDDEAHEDEQPDSTTASTAHGSSTDDGRRRGITRTR